jgi:hypothetical protein
MRVYALYNRSTASAYSTPNGVRIANSDSKMTLPSSSDSGVDPLDVRAGGMSCNFRGTPQFVQGVIGWHLLCSTSGN